MLDKACQRFGAGIKMATGEAVHRGLRFRVDAGKYADFWRGSVLFTAERSRVTYFTTDKAYGRAAVSQGGVRKRRKNHGVFLRFSYSLGLILPLLASDTPVLAFDVLRA